MNKSEIIESIAYVGIPSGTTLVEHSDPVFGLTVAGFDHANSGGMKIMAARMFADQLKNDTADLPEVPDAALFCRLHNAVLDFHSAQLDDCFFEEIRADILCTNRAIAAKIREIAGELRITYKEPRNPSLD